MFNFVDVSSAVSGGQTLNSVGKYRGENISKRKCNQIETSLFNNLETAPRIATS